MAQAQTLAGQTTSIDRIRTRTTSSGLIARLRVAFRRSRERQVVATGMMAAEIGRQTGVRI